ncbi:winged helix-turn-helix transcriptional regulator [Paenibacillus sacheonensis]|uniref:Transcriptional regulator n=1 Tax=Paenibacillus sacheonensis TaxID=742054 RepID=A0A7X5BXA9_9BACL|nr:winged helix family transcriptional regulator [Paenibacillus sacheonensis]MBM7564933.1 two-component system alkaline phosphatase synthesis response regulator PhoP [Paenibacillus sacheonensis]NBC70278.1 transcriptional regulator [Paenibacillus sacheonensis]
MSDLGSLNSVQNGQAPPFPDGAFCDTTRRIVIVSPFPARLQELTAALMARCYDVLTFHNAKEPILPLLENDLFVIDRTWGADETLDGETVRASDCLYLVGEATPAPGPEGRTLLWPSPIDAALATIEALAGQSKPASAEASADRLRFKDVEMDPKRMTVQRGGAKIELTKTEFDLLRVLLSSDGSVLTRQDIMAAIWGDAYFGGSNSVDVHVKSLRQKLGDDPKRPAYIATVRGVGYRKAE